MLGPHLLGFLKEGAIDVEVSFGEPVAFTAASDRKSVARRTEAEVRRQLAESLAGRLSEDDDGTGKAAARLRLDAAGPIWEDGFPDGFRRAHGR